MSTHYFGRKRPTGLCADNSSTPLGKFKQFNAGPGLYPYHMPLEVVLPSSQVSSILENNELVIHMTGSTGGINHPEPQQAVADAMESDVDPIDPKTPRLFYHLGDVVHFYGQEIEYYSQFYQPYNHYPAPIFAIPGNHDGDTPPNDTTPSLTAFVKNFCNYKSEISPDAGNSARHTMTQPNPFWTLDTPYATIIGLYSNVPEGGQFDDDQINWLTNELSQASANKAVILAVHHPAYSADKYHSGSRKIRAILDGAFDKSGRYADAIFAGHIHNYQRFTRTLCDRQIPFIVAGAGGYWQLHRMQADLNGRKPQAPLPMIDSDDIMLENYCDDHHGYLVLGISPTTVRGEYYIVPKAHENWDCLSRKIDSFVLDTKQHVLVKNTTPP